VVLQLLFPNLSLQARFKSYISYIVIARAGPASRDVSVYLTALFVLSQNETRAPPHLTAIELSLIRDSPLFFFEAQPGGQ
jgi:hypothetical protein